MESSYLLYESPRRSASVFRVRFKSTLISLHLVCLSVATCLPNCSKTVAQLHQPGRLSQDPPICLTFRPSPMLTLLARFALKVALSCTQCVGKTIERVKRQEAHALLPEGKDIHAV